MRAQWDALNAKVQSLNPGSDKVTWLIPDDLLDLDEEAVDAPAPTLRAPVGDPPPSLPQGPSEPPDDDDSEIGNSIVVRAPPNVDVCDELVGTPFFDDALGWCAVTAMGTHSGTPLAFYRSLVLPPNLDPGLRGQILCSSKADVLFSLRASVLQSFCQMYNETKRLYGQKGTSFTPHDLVYGLLSEISPLLFDAEAAEHNAIPGRLAKARFDMNVQSMRNLTQSLPPDELPRACSPVSGRSRPLRPMLLSPRQVRRVLAARETLFKFGTFVPRNDREANASPESQRWK